MTNYVLYGRVLYFIGVKVLKQAKMFIAHSTLETSQDGCSQSLFCYFRGGEKMLKRRDSLFWGETRMGTVFLQIVLSSPPVAPMVTHRIADSTVSVMAFPAGPLSTSTRSLRMYYLS